MSRHIVALALAIACAAVTAHARSGVAGQKGPSPKDMQSMQSAIAAAQAGARHPGDDALDCDALQDQLVANMKDPAVQGTIAKQGAEAQQQMDKLNAARQDAPSRGSIAAQMAMGFASGLVPGLGAGLGAASMAGQAAQVHAQMAEAAQNQARMMQNMQDMLAVMPQLMRAQRLLELGQARKCEWAQPR